MLLAALYEAAQMTEYLPLLNSTRKLNVAMKMLICAATVHENIPLVFTHNTASRL